jgi:hypothetical protein
VEKEALENINSSLFETINTEQAAQMVGGISKCITDGLTASAGNWDHTLDYDIQFGEEIES